MSREQQLAIRNIARAIRQLDDVSFSVETLPTGKQDYQEGRRLLYKVLSDNGYELTKSYRPAKIKSIGKQYHTYK